MKEVDLRRNPMLALQQGLISQEHVLYSRFTTSDGHLKISGTKCAFQSLDRMFFPAERDFFVGYYYVRKKVFGLLHFCYRLFHVWRYWQMIDEEKRKLLKSRIDARLRNTMYYSHENVEDLVQDTLERYSRFLNDHPDAVLNEIAYLNRIADNVCNDFFRNQTKRQHLRYVTGTTLSEQGEEIDPIDLVPDEQSLPEEESLQHERIDELYEAIGKLPEPLQTIMRLVARGVSYENIARKTDRAVPTVRKYAKEGETQLKVLMNSDGKE